MSFRQRCFAIMVVAVALGFRLWVLDYKPAHFDEGVNGVLVDEMRERGFYEYHPENYHGPLHFYVLFAAEQLFGRSLWALRLPTVLIGTAAVALLFAFRRWMSFRAVGVAAVAMAVSPAMVFYSRYAIHEMWLPFFSILALYGGIGFAAAWRGGEGRRGDVWALGLGLAGMVLTKETYLLHWIAAAIAMGCVTVFLPRTGSTDGRPDAGALFSTRRKTGESGEPIERPVESLQRSALPVVLVCTGIVAAFYSGFGMHWRGVAGLWETWAPMLYKGYGSGSGSEDAHHKELWYYVKLLWHYEWPVLLSMIAAPVVALGWFRSLDESPAVRYLAFYGLGSFAAYSLIAYKTPWCTIAAFPPLLLVLGWLADRLFAIVGRGVMESAVVTALLTMLFAQPAIASWKLNFRNPTNDGRRYAYVQTTRDIEKLLKPVRALIASDPLNRWMRGYVFGEGHPLHWELADMPNVHFVDDEKSPPSFDADFLLLPEDRLAEVESQLVGVYFKERYLTRDFGTPGWLYLSLERFEKLFPNREPEFHPRVPLEVPR